MKQSFQEAIQASKQRCELELAAAERKAEQVYTKLSSKALAGHEKRVAKIIKQQEKMSPAAMAFAQSHDVEAYREMVSSKIGALHHQTGHEFKALWNEAYGRLFQATGFHPKAYAKTKNESQLEIVVQSGLLGQLTDIVNGMLTDIRIFASGPGPRILDSSNPQPMLPGMAQAHV